jgi:hypothetical protein
MRCLGGRSYLVPLSDVLLVALLEQALVVGHIVLTKDPAAETCQQSLSHILACSLCGEETQWLGESRWWFGNSEVPMRRTVGEMQLTLPLWRLLD